MDITFDPVKRATTLKKRGIDFATDAAKVFAGQTVTLAADKIDYGEARFLTAGWLNKRAVIVIWTPRGSAHHVISMRYCHADEHFKILRGFDRT